MNQPQNRPQIQMVDLRSQYHAIRNEIHSAIEEVLESSAYINGPHVDKFARELAAYTGSAYVIPCGNGTDALQIALMALDLVPGDEVIVPSFTYVATVEVISLLGLIPVYVEVEEDSFTIDISKIEAAITSRTKAIIAVHLFGQSAQMNDLLSLSRKRNLYVIEDNAQALGATFKLENGTEKKTGTLGDIGTTSFFPSKNLGTYGDGGAIFTQNEELAKKCKQIANHGQAKKYHHDIIGVNSRLDTLHAAILSVKLRYLDQYTAKRQWVASYYDKHLTGVPDIQLPYRVPYSTHVFHQYTIKTDARKREALREFLQQNGIPTMVYYPVPQHLQKAYVKYGYSLGDFPVSERLCNEVCSLPIHTEMDEEQLNYIVETIKAFYS